MEIVAHGISVGEGLQNGDVTLLHVVETHGIAAAVVIDLVGDGKTEGVRFARLASDDERIQVVQAARGIAPRGVLDAAIRLLPHLVEPVRRITRVGIVGKIRARKRERSVGQVIEVIYARIKIWKLRSLRRPGRPSSQQRQIARFERWLDGGEESCQRACGKWRRLAGGGTGREVQGRLM